MIRHPLEHGAAQTTTADAILNGDDTRETASHFIEDCLIERLEETHVVDGTVHSLTGTLLSSLQGIVTQRSDGQDGYVMTFTQLSATPHGYGFQRTAPVVEDAATTGIAYDEWAHVGLLGSKHHPTQLVFVER